MTPDQQAILINRSIQGVPIRTIAAELGCTHPTVLRHQHRPDTRALIQREAEAILNHGLMTSRKAILRASAETLRQYKAVAKQEPYDKDLIKQGIDASKTILTVAGLTGQPSTVINTLININDTTNQPALNQLRDYIASKAQVIDVGEDNDKA